MSDIIWNYEDVDNNLLSLYRGKFCLGYFRIDTEDFIMLAQEDDKIKLNITTLRQIVNEYTSALKEAKKIAEIE